MEQHRRSMGRVDALQTSTCCSSRAGSSATLPSASSAGAGSTQVEVADPKGSSSGKALQSRRRWRAAHKESPGGGQALLCSKVGAELRVLCTDTRSMGAAATSRDAAVPRC